MPRRSAVLALVLVLTVLVAGCSGGGNGAAPAGQNAATDGGGGASGGAEATQTAGADESGGTAADAAVRYRIRRGSATLRVDGYDATRSNLTALVERRGGYLSDATQRVHRDGNDTWTTGKLVLRVPAENFSATFGAVKREGDVVDASVETVDVTDRVVDLQARLRNLRAERDRLRTLYREANDTEAVLKVQERLSSVQSTIERLEAKLRSLRQRVNYATITVELREPRPERQPPEETHWYDTGVANAFLESVDGVVVLARASAVALAYALPYLLVLGIPLALVAAAVRWRRGALLP